MSERIGIMVTGAGAPGIAGTIYALRNNPNALDFDIVTTDINDNVVGKYLADKFYRVPPPEAKAYIPAMQEIVRKERTRIIIPQTTREITVLSRNEEGFLSLGAVITVSSHESMAIANDKFLLLEKAKEVGVPYPTYYRTDSEASFLDAVKAMGYPDKKLAVKPRISNGMRGFRILTEGAWDVERFLGEKPDGVETSLEVILETLHRGKWPELLVTEYLPGHEYTVDVFRGEHDSVAIPRLVETMRSGIAFNTSIEPRDDVREYSLELAEALNLRYCFGFQFKLSEDGTPRLLECNPRVQATMVTSVFAGFNLIYYSAMEALGEPARIGASNLEQGLKFKRYWGGVAVDEKGFIQKI
jgi:carbamoyl-phosphate synthase large subunit